MEQNNTKKVVVLYKSHYGSTQQYAQWLAEETGGDCWDLDSVQMDALKHYDVILFGGGLYAAGISGIKSFQKIYPSLHAKKVIVFGVGLSPSRKKTLLDVENASFSDEMKGQVPLFLLRGAFDYTKQKFMHKMMMKLMETKIKSKDPSQWTEDDKGLLNSMKKPVDYLDRTSIKPILDAIADR